MRTAASLESDPMAWVDALSSATKLLFNERRHEGARAELTEIVDSPQRQHMQCATKNKGTPWGLAGYSRWVWAALGRYGSHLSAAGPPP